MRRTTPLICRMIFACLLLCGITASLLHHSAAVSDSRHNEVTCSLCVAYQGHGAGFALPETASAPVPPAVIALVVTFFAVMVVSTGRFSIHSSLDPPSC